MLASRESRSSGSEPRRERRAGIAGPAGQRAQACEQLLDGERLGQVVVGSGVQADHTVADAVERSQHQDRHAVAGPAGRTAHAEPVQIGQPHVEDDQVGLLAARAPPGRQSPCRRARPDSPPRPARPRATGRWRGHPRLPAAVARAASWANDSRPVPALSESLPKPRQPSTGSGRTPESALLRWSAFNRRRVRC